MCKAWEGFTAGAWQSRIDVRDFIQKNYTPYGGDEAFLAPATPRTQALMHKLQGLMKLEQEFGGVLDVDTQTVSSLLNYKPGYLDKDNELIVGLQTDRPRKRGVNPFGGIRMAREACRAYGYELSGQVEQEFAYRTTHNDGVFRVYNEQTRAARHCGLITGLPDAYGRGRIIGDYRRVALYGTDRLIEEKKKDKAELGRGAMTDENIRLIEEVWRQIDFLGKLRDMAALYGCDISRPAQSAREAVQWTYFGYLGAIKEQNGAAMSLGRVSTFLDIYFERDLAAGRLDEAGGTEYTVEDVLRRVRRCKPYIYESGGVTVTGGEPLAQPVFTAALLKALRAEGYHTALDTSGAGALAAAREVLAHTDLVLADLKFSSEDGYRAHTGGSLAHTLDFLALTQELGVPLWVRHVVIPGLTDGEAHIRALARMAGQFHNLQKVELLGFRKLCLEKYGAIGVPFPLADTPEMDAAALCRLEDAVRRELPDLA